MDAIIVGAGIMGAALAFRLAQRGARVRVIEAGLPAGGASGRSFGWVNASFFLTEAHFHLRHDAMAAHRRLAAELGLAAAPTGCLWWEEEGPALQAQGARLAKLGYAVEVLSREDLRGLEPNLADWPCQALRFVQEDAVDLAALTERLLAEACALGAEVWAGCPVTGLVLSGGRVTGVCLAQGEVLADHVVLAAGTGAAGLLDGVGLHLPMLDRPGAMVATRPLPPVLSHVLATPGQEVRQDAAGRILAPTSAGHQGDGAARIAETPADLAGATLARLRALLPGQALALDRVVLAARPVPGDGLPVLGAVTAGRVEAGLSLAVMHSGATLAPLVAEVLAAELAGNGTGPGLAPFHPGRLLTVR